jgi:5-methyltetrahydropteroyltriglutamate--homocysteine methyltransferase
MAKAPLLFPTYVVGSLPRPQWVREVIDDRKTGRITEAKAEKLLDDAILSAVRLQERAGIDYVSEGEWRRESYVKVFTEAVKGFTPDIVPAGPNTDLMYPAVTGKIKARRSMATGEVKFLKRHAKAKVIVAVPSPYTVARRMWDARFSTKAYPTREEFMEACIPIVRKEVQALARAGADAIQLDDPWLALLVDSDYRQRQNITDIEHEIELSVRGVNGSVEGLKGVPVSVHLCHAHINRKHATKGPYDLIIGALGRMNVQRFAMEFATPDAGGIAALKKFPTNKLLGLGVIDHTDRHIETPEEVAERAERAMEYVPKERLTLNPDCGFAPSSIHSMDIDEAYLKLRALARGAQLLRERHG